jgi:hypothetical protein
MYKYVDEFFFRMRNVAQRSEAAYSTKPHILCLMYFFGISADFEIMWKKYGTVRQVTNDNIKQRMRFVCWMKKGIDTHS